MATDPICGMTVDEASALRAERDGHTSYFCSEHCRNKFLSTPATVKQEDKPHGKAIYTCPMHPEIEQDHPGPCPKCGMALELKTPAPDAQEDDSELRDMSRRFWIGAALALPVFIVAMAHLVPAWGHAEWVNGNASRWGQFILSTPVERVSVLTIYTFAEPLHTCSPPWPGPPGRKQRDESSCFQS